MNKKAGHQKRGVAAALAISVLGTQCLFAYQPENNIWTQRRRTIRRQSPALMVSLSVGSPPLGSESLVTQFPTPQNLGSALSKTLSKTVPKGFIKDHAKLLAALSSSSGTVRKVSLGKNYSPSGPVVLHIQDVHMNQEAQWNIRETVRALMQSGRVDLVALEGGTEEIQLQPYVDYPHPQTIALTADYLLKENKISGPIHAALTGHGKLPRFLGIDDPTHYEANIRAYLDSAPKLDQVRRKIESLRVEMEEQKKRVFSPILLSFDQRIQAYREGKISLGDYIQCVLSVSPKGSATPDVVNFNEALKMERALDFKQVEYERAQLISRLTQNLTPEEIQTLLTQSVAYRSGQMGYGDFYTELKGTCRGKGIRLSDFPAMDAYVRYVLLAEGINAEKLLNDLAILEKKAYDRAATTPEEKALAFRSRQAWLTGKLVDFSLIPSEWEEYKAFPSRDLGSFESFYREAQDRDGAMAQHLMEALNSDGGPRNRVAILVAGGYHAEGMAQQLTRQGVTVVSFVPKIEKIDTAGGATYLSVFTQEKTPLEKLFQGEKLFLAPLPFPKLSQLKIVFWAWARQLWVGEGKMSEETRTELERLRSTPVQAVKNLVFKGRKLYLRTENREVPIIDELGNLSIGFEKDISKLKPIPIFRRLWAVVVEFPAFAFDRWSRFFTYFVFQAHKHRNTSVDILALRLIGMERIARASDVGFVVGAVLGLTLNGWLFPVIWFGTYALSHYTQIALFPEAPAMAEKGPVFPQEKIPSDVLMNHALVLMTWDKILNGSRALGTPGVGTTINYHKGISRGLVASPEIPSSVLISMAEILKSGEREKFVGLAEFLAGAYGNGKHFPSVVMETLTGILKGEREEKKLGMYAHYLSEGFKKNHHFPSAIFEASVERLKSAEGSTVRHMAELVAGGIIDVDSHVISSKFLLLVLNHLRNTDGVDLDPLAKCLVVGLGKRNDIQREVVQEVANFIEEADDKTLISMSKSLSDGMELDLDYPPVFLKSMAARVEKAEGNTLEQLVASLTVALGKGHCPPEVVDSLIDRLENAEDGSLELVLTGLARGFDGGHAIPPGLMNGLMDRMERHPGQQVVLKKLVEVLAFGFGTASSLGSEGVEKFVRFFNSAEREQAMSSGRSGFSPLIHCPLEEGMMTGFKDSPYVPPLIVEAVVERFIHASERDQELLGRPMAYGFKNAKNISPSILNRGADLLKTLRDNSTLGYLAMFLGDHVDGQREIPQGLLEAAVKKLDAKDGFALSQVARLTSKCLRMGEDVSVEIATSVMSRLNNAKEDELQHMVHGLSSGLKSHPPSSWVTQQLVEQIEQADSQQLQSILIGLEYGLQEADVYPMGILEAVARRLNTTRGEALFVSAKILNRGMKDAKDLPIGILETMAGELEVQLGPVDTNLINGLIIGFEKTQDNFDGVLEVVEKQIAQADPFIILGLSRAIGDGHVLPPKILRAWESCLLNAGEKELGPMLSMMGGDEINYAHGIPMELCVTLAGLIQKSKIREVALIAHILAKGVPTMEIPSPETLGSVLNVLNRYSSGFDGKMCEEALTFVIGSLSGQKISEVDSAQIDQSLENQLQRITQCHPGLTETAYFLLAASRGQQQLETALDGYERALAGASSLPPGTRYDVRKGVELAARQGRYINAEDWQALADAKRIEALGPYLTFEEFVAARALTMTSGRNGKWEVLRETYQRNVFSWDPHFYGRFSEGVALVGAPAMFRFVGRERKAEVIENDHHESMFDGVKAFLESLSDRERGLFINNVFDQVWMDQSVDENGRNSRAQLILLLEEINSLGPQWMAVLNGENFGEPSANQMRDELLGQGVAFQSWRNFKRLRVLLLFSQHRYLLESIASFQDGTVEGGRIHRYVTQLILHPGMSDFEAVKEWVGALQGNDATFFARSDRHSGILHEEKKASRYFKFPRIDLTPQRLARGLILGQLDDIQSFRSFTVDFYPELGLTSDLESLSGQARVGLLCAHKSVNQSSLRTGLLGVLEQLQSTVEASSPENRSALGGIRNSIKWVEVGMKGTPPKSFNNPVVAEGVAFKHLVDAGLRINTPRYRLRILPKSDPQAALTGNEAPSCMGFGTGKNTLYLFNPNNAIFALSKEVVDPNGSPRERILATSVLTLDRRFPRPVDQVVADVKKALEKGDSTELSLRRLLGDDFLEEVSLDSYAGVDNVEGAPSVLFNGDKEGFERIVEQGYRKFFEAYFKKFSFTPGGRAFNRKRIPVGLAYGDFMTNLPVETNFYYPQAPNAYSDKVGENVGVITLDAETPQPDLAPLMQRRMVIRPLSVEDIFEAAYVENRVFEGSALKNHLAGVQNEFIAAISNGAIRGKDREFMGLGLFENGRLAGYILAYAGIDQKTGEDGEIYVSDYAVMPAYRNSVASGRLMNQFLGRVQEHARYRAGQGKMTTLFFEALGGESGSYRLLRLTSERERSKGVAEREVWESNRLKWMKRWGLSVLEEIPNGNSTNVRMEVAPAGTNNPEKSEAVSGGILWSLGGRDRPERAWWVESLALIGVGVVFLIMGWGLGLPGIDVSSLLRLLGIVFVGAHVAEFLGYRIFSQGRAPPLKNAGLSLVIALPLFLIPCLNLSNFFAIALALILKPSLHWLINKRQFQNQKVSIHTSPKVSSLFSWKVKVWDPLREQLKWFFPLAILFPFVLVFLCIQVTEMHSFVSSLIWMWWFAEVFIQLGIPSFLEFEHRDYSVPERKALMGPAKSVARWTLWFFLLIYVALSPWGLNGVSEIGDFFDTILNPTAKAFFLSALAGNIAGLVRHTIHNGRTFPALVQRLSSGWTSPGPLLPLSRSGSRQRTKGLITPNNLFPMKAMSEDERFRLLSEYYDLGVKIVAGQKRREREQKISRLVEKIQTDNPGFFDAYKELLVNHRQLAEEPTLLEYLLNLGIFTPLDANAFGFSAPQKEWDLLWVDLAPGTWEGMPYLGTQIYWAQRAKEHEKRWLFSHRIGIMPTPMKRQDILSYVNVLIGAQNSSRGTQLKIVPGMDQRQVLETCLVLLFSSDLQLGLNIGLTASLMAEAHKVKDLGQVVRYLKDFTYTRLLLELNSGQELSAPTREDVRKATVLKESPLIELSQTGVSNGIPSLVASYLSGLRDALILLRKKGQYSLALVMFTQALQSIYTHDTAPIHAGIIRLLEKEGLFTAIFPQFVLNRSSEEAVNWAIRLINQMLQNNFVSNSFRERQINELREKQEREKKRKIAEEFILKQAETNSGEKRKGSGQIKVLAPPITEVSVQTPPVVLAPVMAPSPVEKTVSPLEMARREYDHLMSLSVPDWQVSTAERLNYIEGLAAGIDLIKRIGDDPHMVSADRESVLNFANDLRQLMLEALGEMAPNMIVRVLKKVSASIDLEEIQLSLEAHQKHRVFPMGVELHGDDLQQQEENEGSPPESLTLPVFVHPSFNSKMPSDARLKKIIYSCLIEVEKQIGLGKILRARSEIHRREAIFHIGRSGFDLFAIQRDESIVVLWFGSQAESHKAGGKANDSFDNINLDRAKGIREGAVDPLPLPSGYFQNGNGRNLSSFGTVRSFGFGVPGIFGPLMVGILVGLASTLAGLPFGVGLFLVWVSSGVSFVFMQRGVNLIAGISRFTSARRKKKVEGEPGYRAGRQILALLGEKSPRLGIESISGPQDLSLVRARRAVGEFAMDKYSVLAPGGLARDLDMQTKMGFVAVVTREMLITLPKQVAAFEHIVGTKPVYWVVEDELVRTSLQKIRPRATIILHSQLVNREESMVVVSGAALDQVVGSLRIDQRAAIALPRGAQVDMEGVSSTSLLRNAVFYLLDEFLAGRKIDFNTLLTIDTIARQIASAA